MKKVVLISDVHSENSIGFQAAIAAATAASGVIVVSANSTKGDLGASCIGICSGVTKTIRRRERSRFKFNLVKSVLLAGDSPHPSLNHINTKSRKNKRKDF